MTDSKTAKKPPSEARGDCSICKGWVNDGRGGTSHRNGENKVTYKHNKDTQHHHFAIAVLVGQHTAKQRQQIYYKQEIRESLTSPF